VLREHGNMSSATILFILERMIRQNKHGENLMGLAFGPGLTVESMILEAA
jgi:predicted naringenin-chalcone synthase